jgi:MGT family glycosyltransferase
VAHFLFLSIPDRGHIFPSLAVAAELGCRGHRVTYLTGSGLTHLMTAPGVSAMEYDSGFLTAPKVSGMGNNGGHEMLMLTVDESAAMLRAVAGRFGNDRPDAVAYDVATSHAGRILRRKWDVPAIQLNPMFVQNENFSFAESYVQDGVYIGPSPEDMGTWAGKILDLTAEHGLDVEFDDFFLEQEKCNLVYVPREFQIHGDSFGREFSFVGPCTGDRGFLPGWAKPDPEEPGTELPVVLVSLGTVFNQEFTSFFKDAIAAFSGLAAHIVMTVGDGVDIARLGPVPPNIEVHSWLSHVSVLDQASAYVSHGGMTSLMECFAAGKPAIVAPMSPIDQPTAWQVRDLNLGRAIRPADVTAERLRHALADLLADDEARQNAIEMRACIQRAGGTARAADVAEAFLDTGVPQG